MYRVIDPVQIVPRYSSLIVSVILCELIASSATSSTGIRKESSAARISQRLT